MLEIHQQMIRESCQQVFNTITETANSEKQEHYDQIKTQNNSNRNTTHSNTTEKKLTKES